MAEESSVTINILYQNSLTGDKRARDELFSFLSVRFKVIAHLKIWNRQDAEEVVQEALMTIARQLEEIEIHTSFAAWAYKVLDNKLLAYIGGRQNLAGKATTVDPAEIALEAPDQDVDLDLKKRLFDCFQKLRSANTRYARIIALHYQGYSTDEISARLEMKRGAMYMLLFRARSSLKNCLDTGEVSS